MGRLSGRIKSKIHLAFVLFRPEKLDYQKELTMEEIKKNWPIGFIVLVAVLVTGIAGRQTAVNPARGSILGRDKLQHAFGFHIPVD